LKHFCGVGLSWTPSLESETIECNEKMSAISAQISKENEFTSRLRNTQIYCMLSSQQPRNIQLFITINAILFDVQWLLQRINKGSKTMKMFCNAVQP